MVECKILSIENGVGYCRKDPEGACGNCEHAFIYVGVRPPPSPGALEKTSPVLKGADLVIVDTYQENGKSVPYTQRVRKGDYEVIDLSL